MSKDLILSLIFSALDKILTDELMAKTKAEMIEVLKKAAMKTETPIDDYAVKTLKRFLEA